MNPPAGHPEDVYRGAAKRPKRGRKARTLTAGDQQLIDLAAQAVQRAHRFQKALEEILEDPHNAFPIAHLALKETRP